MGCAIKVRGKALFAVDFAHGGHVELMHALEHSAALSIFQSLVLRDHLSHFLSHLITLFAHFPHPVTDMRLLILKFAVGHFERLNFLEGFFELGVELFALLFVGGL